MKLQQMNNKQFFVTLPNQIIRAKNWEKGDNLNEITGELIYSSSDTKAKELGIYFFCAVLIILVIYLIITKFL